MMTICGEIDCEGCLVKYVDDISLCKAKKVIHCKCSTCEMITYNQPHGLSFCQNCGADMRKEDEWK